MCVVCVFVLGLSITRSPTTVMQFVVWASHRIKPAPGPKETISRGTIKKYICGLKAWHDMHRETYPSVDKEVKQLLRTTPKRETALKIKKKEKDPVLVLHLKFMMEKLKNGTKPQQAALLITLCAFWGFARLGELVTDIPSKLTPRACDVEQDESGRKITITIWDAKTAKKGEPQFLILRRQKSALDPVRALEKWIASEEILGGRLLFSWKEGARRNHLTKAQYKDIINPIWAKVQGRRLTGHSMRVGGASLLWNLGVSVPIVIEAGRWKSNAYDVYLKKYTPEERKEAKKVLYELRN